MAKQESQGSTMGDMGKLYDQQARPFAERSPTLLWWQTIGIPAYDRHLDGFYGRGDLHIVDLGCASGRVEEFLMSRGIPPQCFTGVEISPDQVEIARRNIPAAEFIVGDITKVHLDPNHFDLAISNMVLEFLDPRQLAQAMKNTFDALKPGGIFFFITTHPDKMEITSGLQKPGPFTVQFPWGGEGPNYYRTRDDFIGTTENAGFRIDAIEDLNIPPEAEKQDPKEYQRYRQYPNTRLVIKATKPAEK